MNLINFNFYNLAKFFLFKLDPEIAHFVSLQSLKLLDNLQLLKPKNYENQKDLMGLCFKNPIGLAAGLDKNGDYIDCLGSLGFSFIEVGTVTPVAQLGNPKPRLFRFLEHKAIVNHMGFNNKGVDYLVKNLKKFKNFKNKKFTGIIGVNIGKNFFTPIEPIQKAYKDYEICFQKVYKYADYIALNISSPNTKNLRQLQSPDFLDFIAKNLKKEQIKLAKENNKYVPIVIKISPDLSEFEIKAISEVLIINKIDGAIATNTTVSSDIINKYKLSGGLSGKPLKEKSNFVLKTLKNYVHDNLVIIASGGVMNSFDFCEKIELGADLVQVYTGLIYNGPDIINFTV